MIKVSVLYPNRDACQFDAEYFVGIHLPLAKKLLGPAMKSISGEIGIPGVGISAPPFVATMQMTFDSKEAFMTAFVPIAGEFVADMPNFTNAEHMVQVGEVKF